MTSALAMKPGHDAALAFVKDGRLEFSIEAEKDSFLRNGRLHPEVVLAALELCSEVPDIIAIGGWHKELPGFSSRVGAGYEGLAPGVLERRTILGHEVAVFSSSHERSHIAMALGMWHGDPRQHLVILVWEGAIGAFYEWNGTEVVRRVDVLAEPGGRYAALFALADPTFAGDGAFPRLEDAGKLMAIAGLPVAEEVDPQIEATVDELLRAPTCYPFQKQSLAWSPVYNSGVSIATVQAARIFTNRIFDTFLDVATSSFPPGLPLLVNGGCGLNCDWNQRWSTSAHFSEVFVPPCTNDSGSAIGTAIDAIGTLEGQIPSIEWSVYSGSKFVADTTAPGSWRQMPYDSAFLAAEIERGALVAWVEGRAEIGPRALGHRSILASAVLESSRDRINALKRREAYRPVAPVCRATDFARLFDGPQDRFMLYTARVRTPELKAVTHADGTARVQALARTDSAALWDLLGSTADLTGYPVLCNTSLNYPGSGFINRSSELFGFCDGRGIRLSVIDGELFRNEGA